MYGHEISSYRISDLRKATAHISQETTLYPLSVKENIGVGFTDHINHLDMINKAAALGGASEYISGLDNGLDTILEPVSTASMGFFGRESSHPLKAIFDQLEKKVLTSGKVP